MTLCIDSENRHDEAVNRLVEKVLCQVLGSEATQIIFGYLESRYLIRKQEIAQNLDSFNRALEEYLGTGAVVIEKLINESLDFQLGEGKGFDSASRSRIVKLA